MVRLRFAILAGATGTALLCGCGSLSSHSFLGRRSTCSGPDCCAGGVISDQEGPVVDAGNIPVPPPVGQPAYPPGAQPFYPPGTLAPQGTVPQLNPAPRLVPQPQQSPTMPYTPQ